MIRFCKESSSESQQPIRPGQTRPKSSTERRISINWPRFFKEGQRLMTEKITFRPGCGKRAESPCPLGAKLSEISMVKLPDEIMQWPDLPCASGSRLRWRHFLHRALDLFGYVREFAINCMRL